MKKEPPYNVFISYAQDDTEYLAELLKHLKALERTHMISVWHDRLIQPTSNWNDSIMKALETSEIILLFVSASFIASDFIWEVELRMAMEKHEKNEAIILPILAKPCYWEDMPFSILQMVPAKAVPISEYKNRDMAYAEVLKALKIMIDNFRFTHNQ